MITKYNLIYKLILFFEFQPKIADAVMKRFSIAVVICSAIFLAAFSVNADVLAGIF